MKLILDLETSGLPLEKQKFKFYEPNMFEKYNSCRIVQIGYLLCDNDNNIVKEVSFIVKPHEFKIENSDIHNIKHDYACEKGENIIDVFSKLEQDIKDCDIFISHNLNFDYNVLLSECFRYKQVNLIDLLSNMKKFCTMLEGQKKLKLKNWPKLNYLVQQFYPDIIWEQKHEALDDAKYCHKCYIKLI